MSNKIMHMITLKLNISKIGNLSNLVYLNITPKVAK